MVSSCLLYKRNMAMSECALVNDSFADEESGI